MTLRNLTKMVQLLCDGVDLLAVDAGAVVTVSIDLARSSRGRLAGGP